MESKCPMAAFTQANGWTTYRMVSVCYCQSVDSSFPCMYFSMRVIKEDVKSKLVRVHSKFIFSRCLFVCSSHNFCYSWFLFISVKVSCFIFLSFFDVNTFEQPSNNEKEGDNDNLMLLFFPFLFQLIFS
jgi:hypothetical protein